VGRLIVHPDLQRQGIGSRLLLGIEACFPDVARFELFTGDRSEATIRLYERLGYRVFRREAQTTQVNLVFMEKCVGE
jgi:ribosomal protein S18 acetylase RimI-like enzyme